MPKPGRPPVPDNLKPIKKQMVWDPRVWAGLQLHTTEPGVTYKEFVNQIVWAGLPNQIRRKVLENEIGKTGNC